MKLTDIDLSSLAEVAAAVTLLEHVHRELATGGTPLPSLPSAAEFVVNPVPSADDPMTAQPATTVLQQGTQSVAFQSMDECRAALVADAETRRVEPMDAASVFGGAPAQSATPLPQSAPSTAAVAPSPTALAAPPASGPVANALPVLAPLPAPSAAAPAAPVAQPSPVGGVELDTDGLPWDERIHAGTKRKNADGRWTSKRGINDPDLVPRVVAQLRAQMEAGGVTAQSAAPLPVSTPAPSTAPLAALPATSGLASLAAPTPPALPAAQTPGAPQQSSGAPAPTTFQDFMTALTVEVQAGRVPIEALGAVCQPLGGVSALNSKPELIPVAWASLKAKYPGML